MAHEPAASLDREAIRETFPWSVEAGKDMIIGSDIDAIMSAAYLSEYLDWNPIGFYTNFEYLYTAPEVTREQVLDAVWVDLDIYHSDISSIGHHILNFRLSDDIAQHADTLNPNLLRGMYHGNFPRKYPLGTIHFLTWLHDRTVTVSDEQTLLYWVPDSTWINGQSHRFRDNVRDWLFNCIPVDFLTDTFEQIDTADFERALQDHVYPRIESSGFTRGRGQVSSRHYGLGGYQCAFENPNEKREELQKLVDAIAEVMGWDPFAVPADMDVIRGERTSNYPYSNVNSDYDGIDEFLEDRQVFSYAVPNGGVLNYTTGIELSQI